MLYGLGIRDLEKTYSGPGVKEAPDPGSTTLVKGPSFFDHEKHILIKIVLYQI
jgi:hypothetical protein